MAVIEREPDARCRGCAEAGSAYCDQCGYAVSTVHDLWREYESLTAQHRGAVETLRRIAARRPSQDDAGQAFFRSREDARAFLASLDQLGGQSA